MRAANDGERPLKGIEQAGGNPVTASTSFDNMLAHAGLSKISSYLNYTRRIT